MRKLIAIFAAAILCGQAHAQAWPSKPIRLAVPFPAGADTDLTARVVASWLERRLRQPVVVENRPGAGQIVATDYMLKSPPDGHTLLFAAHSISYLDALIKATPFDPLKDIKPIAMVAGSGFALVVNPNLPVRTIQEFIAYVRANPGKVNWGDATPWPVAEFADLKTKNNLNWVNVPFAGGAAAFTATMAGDVQVYNSSPTQALEAHRTGKVRIIVYTEPQRHPLIPDIPTMAESGFPGFTANFWFGLFGQTALPNDIVQRLNGEILEMFKDSDSMTRIQKFGYRTYPLSQPDAQREYERVARFTADIFRSLGVKPQ